MTDPSRRQRLLLVEDEPDHVALAMAHLPGAHEVATATTLAEARAVLAEQGPFGVALVDLNLPDGSGIDLAHELARADVAVVVVSSSIDLDELRSAVGAGIHGYISKPVTREQLVITVENALRLRDSERIASRLSRVLEEELVQRSSELAAAQEEIIHRLAAVAEQRDRETGEHLRRIAHLGEALARAVGLDEEEVRRVRLAAPLHDIGKTALPDDVLYEDGPFTAEQQALMATHTIHGWEILSGSGNPILDMAALVARHHHERVDGRGHPDGLAGEDIPLAARITAVVDVYDALSNERRYKPALPADEVAEAMRRDPGHLDQHLVDLLLRITSSSDDVTA